MITLPIDLELLCGGHTIPLQANLIYSSTDPFAVTMEVILPDGDQVHWRFARDLLAEGLNERAGAGRGDVVIFPCMDDSLHITLQSPEGKAQLHTTPDDVDAFLEMTFALVAQGHELDAVDIDRELNEIFGTAA